MEQSFPSNEDDGLQRCSGKRKRKMSLKRQEEEEDDEDYNTEEIQEKRAQEDKKQEKEQDTLSSKKHWSCPACTFLNETSRCFCEMCETLGPSQPPATARAFGGTTSAFEWSCVACTMVNPAAMRVCAACGTLNPRPGLASGLSISRIAKALENESFSSCSDENNSDENDSESDDEDENKETWICQRCNALANGSTCLNCFAKRTKVVRENEKTKSEENEQILVTKRKRRKQDKAKIAYGVPIYELKKLILNPMSGRLVGTLQTLTHTLAMMDASADNEWTDGSSFLVRSFGGGSSRATAKDPELLSVLVIIFSGHERKYSVEVRLLAVQSINYLMKMDRHMFARSKIKEVVRLYITELLAWKNKNKTSAVSSSTAKNEQMIVEECLGGLSIMCSTEGSALREVMAQEHFAGYLSFLLSLVDGDGEKHGDFHPSIVMTALGVLQKCCMKLRWITKSSQNHYSTGNANAKKSVCSPTAQTENGELTLVLAMKLIDFLRHVLQHKHVPLHVKAAKCLLLIFHRTPYDCPEIMAKLVTPEVLRKFVAVVVNTNNDESEESRLAMVTLLLHLFDNRPQLVNVFVREKIYTNLFSGILPLLHSSSTSLRTNVLKLVSLLTRVVCRKHSLGSANSSCRSSMDVCAPGDKLSAVSTSLASRSPRSRRNRQRLNSLPDPDVLSTLLLDFIRADSITAVNALLKDGADLNASRMLDVHGNEFDKPLNVAVECASLGMVRLLLKRGADIHQVGIGGTALHVAARAGRCHVAAFLLQCGARVQAKDREKRTVLDVVNLVDKTASEDSSMKPVPSPMKKLLEFHQRTAGLRDYDSDLSESDELACGTSRAWFYASDQDDEYGDDDDDDMDDDEFDGEEGYYMDYGNDDEDELEGFDGAGQSDEEMGGQSDEDMIDVATELSERRPDAILPESEMKLEESSQNADGDGLRLIRRNHAIGGSDDNCQNDDMILENEACSATAVEVYEFSVAITQCLLAVLHDMDIQNVERSVICTVACVLEMAPSQLIHALREVDVVLILDTIYFLLQGAKLRQNNAIALTCSVNEAMLSSSPTATHVASAAQNLPSFILAVRMLEAMVRKSSKESSLFHQIERRGIREQIELLNDASACWVSTGRDDSCSRGHPDTIFGRGLNLLKSLQSDVLESGMLYLHKMRNLARRLREFSDESRLHEKHLILIDLVDLFEQPNSITTYEFKQSELLPAVLQYLSPQGDLDKTRALALMRAFERCPLALKHLIFRLQSIITQEETFPLVSFNAGKGRELYPLTRQLKIVFVRLDRNAGARQHIGNCDHPKERSIQLSPLAHFQSFERSVFRCIPVIDSDLSLLYCNLVGHSIQKVVEGKWKKFIVVGYDDTRSSHLVRPSGGTDDDLAEMVLHDSQCKLTGNVEAYENIALDLTLFGPPHAMDAGHLADSKKKRKNKRKRKSATQKQQHDNDSTCQVEVRNTGVLKMAKLPGAWYAATLVNESDKTCNSKDQTCEEKLAAQDTHSIKLLADNRILRNVPADCLRPRTIQPQVGSVVKVDGAFGEVTRIYSNDSLSSGTASVLFDVKMKSNSEKSCVKKDRVRFPAHQATLLTVGEEGDRIEAMSMRRLFSARDSSLVAGNVGDRVWVLPPSGSLVTGLCVAGTIKSFPPGSDSVCEFTTVLVDISFGSSQPPLTVRVNQDRILKFAVDGGVLPGRSSSRLLAALQMASGRSGSSRLFGGERNGNDGSTSAIHRAVDKVAGSLQQRQNGGGQGLSGTAMAHFRSLILHNSTISGSMVNDVDNGEHVLTTTHGAQLSPLPHEPTGSEVQTEDEAAASVPEVSMQEKVFMQEKSNDENLLTVRRYLKPQCAKPKMVVSQLPKVSLVVGFRKCDATSVTAQDRIVVSSELGLERVDKKSTMNKAAPASSLLIQLNSSTQRFEANAGARKVLLEIFNSFSVSGASQKKKRRKLSPVGQWGVQIGVPWDIEKFIAFMMAVRGAEKSCHTESIAKYCVNFSKYADPDTNRRLLKLEGFISFVVHECKDATKSKQMLKFLRSRGYSEKYLASSASRSSSDDAEEKDLFDNDSKAAVATRSSNKVRQPLVLRGFPADQNVLKCVEDLRRENHSWTCGSPSCSDTTSTTTGTSLPPWKLTYELYCDFQIEWEAQSSPKTSVSDLMGRGTGSLESLSAIAAKPPTQLLSHGVATLGSYDATDELRWLGRIIDTQADNGSHNGIVVPDSVASAVRLFRYLFQFRADAASQDEALWTSPRLYNKLERQMQDVLSMCSGIYPPWCDALVTHCKFFFPRDLRERLFRSTSFGCTRSLHWFRNRLNIEESSADLGISSMVGGGVYNQEISISPIPKERVKVYRENVLQSAEAVMKMHAKRKAVLDVIFVGEKGYGSGVTAAFYSTIAHALQVVTENQKDRFWIPGEDDEIEFKQRVATIGDIVDDAPVICHSNGLFPYPHRTPSSKLIERFRMMGRLAGKALMDERLLPLPLSQQFIKLVVGESFGLEELGDIFLSHGRILYSMYKASKKLIAGKQDVQIDHIDVQDWLDAVGFTFIDPLSQEPLVAGGEDIAVTPNNLTLYVRAVLELWLDSGIRAQVLAFREGISEVLPLAKLRLLFVPELLSLLCGEEDIQWNVDSLMKDTKLAHGYTKDSQPVQFFFEVLEEMSITERRGFLLYATGCPNLPPGGFQALKPPFEVVRRVVDTSNIDRALPFARTCTNTLHLPAYSSKMVLAKQMTFAIANSRGVIDRD